jgi:high-affinity nickel-transport protein
MIHNITNATGKFWDGVQLAGDYYDAIGGGICGCFIIFGGLSVMLYKPWRRWMDRRHGRSMANDEERYRDDALGSEEDTAVAGCETGEGQVFEREQATTVDKGASARVTATEER